MAKKKAKKAPASRPKRVSLDSLKPTPRNARIHPDRNRSDLAASVKEFGAARSVVMDGDGHIQAGAGVLEAAVEAGITEAIIVPADGKTLVVVERSDLKGKRADAYGIADNKTGESSEWNEDQLRETMTALADDGMANATGFDEAELAALFAPTDVVQDPVPDPPKTPITKPGDLWILGDHRLLCGDATRGEDVERVMGGERINVAFTSPPYANQRKYDETSGFKPVAAEDYVEWWEPIQANVAAHIADDGSFFVNIKPHCEDGGRVLYVIDLALAMCRGWGWTLIDELCWKRKGVPGGWEYRFKNEFEPVYHFAKEKPKCDKFAVATRGTTFTVSADNRKRPSVGGKSVFDCNSENQKDEFEGLVLPGNVVEINGETESEHNAAFPVGLPAWFMTAFSASGDNVFDPFVGSGTTLIAAEQLGRTCYAMEISPAYCDVSVKRWEALTGKKAKKERKTRKRR